MQQDTLYTIRVHEPRSSLNPLDMINLMPMGVCPYPHFAAQLKNAERFDVLIAISCSGNSPNILRAVRYAKDFSKMAVIGFTGDDGGKLAEEAEYLVKVPSPDIKVQEDAHLALCHAITMALEK